MRRKASTAVTVEEENIECEEEETRIKLRDARNALDALLTLPSTNEDFGKYFAEKSSKILKFECPKPKLTFRFPN